MRLATLAAVARARADSLGQDATKWNRLACKAREAICRAARARRHAERQTAVEVPDAPDLRGDDTDDEPLDEDVT
jgi:hypothetical protein